MRAICILGVDSEVEVDMCMLLQSCFFHRKASRPKFARYNDVTLMDAWKVSSLSNSRLTTPKKSVRYLSIHYSAIHSYHHHHHHPHPHHVRIQRYRNGRRRRRRRRNRGCEFGLVGFFACFCGHVSTWTSCGKHAWLPANQTNQILTPPFLFLAILCVI
jgi:hypothetical protein